jgi:hypothetical protein
MNEQLEVAASDRLSEDVTAWLMRCYESQESWKQKAREVFMACNGDSVLSRTRLAAIVRKYFIEDKPQPEDVECWKDGFEGITIVHVEPPKVSASNAGYVDWLFVADYLLLGCAAITDGYTEENQRRETEFQQVWSSYQLRLVVHDARGLIREHPKASDSDILELLKKTYDKASLANIKEARLLERAAVPHNKPVLPERPDPLPLYKPVYFSSLTDCKQQAAT